MLRMGSNLHFQCERERDETGANLYVSKLKLLDEKLSRPTRRVRVVPARGEQAIM